MSKSDWYIVNGVARWWDGEKLRRFKWTEPKGWYQFQEVDHYWDGENWLNELDKDESKIENEISTRDSQKINAIFCEVCNSRPGESIVLKSASSRIIWWNYSKVDAILCALCAEQVYIRQQTRTLTQGWWGPLSALATIWFSISNIQRIGAHRSHIPRIHYEGSEILRPQYNVRSNPAVIIATSFALFVIASIGISIASQPTPVSDTTPTTYNQTCWQDKGNDKLSLVNCDSPDADYEVYQVVSNSELCASSWVEAGAQYACLQKKF